MDVTDHRREWNSDMGDERPNTEVVTRGGTWNEMHSVRQTSPLPAIEARKLLKGKNKQGEMDTKDSDKHCR